MPIATCCNGFDLTRGGWLNDSSFRSLSWTRTVPIRAPDMGYVLTGHTLKYSALIDTVVHELAHLRYMNHGPRWESLYRRMLRWARKQGIYEPREAALPPDPKPSAPAQPHAEQLRLFTRHGPSRS